MWTLLNPKLWFLVPIFLTIFEQLSCAETVSSDESSTLKLVQIILRHGDREPDDVFPHGVGALTDVGKRQMYDLGLYIRQRYDKVIVSTEYDPSSVLIVSSDKDRNINSASTLAHGLYRDFNLAANWYPDEKISFEPIPVHTIPTEHDRILQITANCPRREQLFDKSLKESVTRYFRENPQLVEYYSLQKHGDLSLVEKAEAEDVSWFHEMNFDQQELFYNRSQGFPVPEWTLPLFENENYTNWRTIINELVASPNGPHRMEYFRLYSGPFIKTLIDNLDQKLNGTNDKKLILYCGHDRNTYGLIVIISLGGSNKFPLTETGAALMMEMHQPNNGAEPYLEFWYKNVSSSNMRHLIDVPNCGDPCTIKQFKKMMSEFIPLDYEKECQVESNSLYSQQPAAGASYGNLDMFSFGIAAAIVIVLTVLTFAIAILRRRSKMRYQRM